MPRLGWLEDELGAELKSPILFWPGRLGLGHAIIKQGVITVAIKIEDLEKWIDECIKNDEGFRVKSLDPEVEKAKTMIKQVIRKLRGRID